MVAPALFWGCALFWLIKSVFPFGMAQAKTPPPAGSPSGYGATMPGPGGWTGYLVGIVALFVLHALFASAETALRSVSRSRMALLAEEGNRRAASVVRLLERPASFLTAIQILKTALTLAIAVTTFSLLRQLTDRADFFSRFSGALTVLSVIFFLLLFGELIPKVIASQRPDPVALFSAAWIRLFTAIIYPVFRAIDRLSQLFVSRESAKIARSPVEAEEEIKMMAAGGVETGEIEPEEQEMIRGVLTATDKVAREVMVPRIDLTAVEADSPVEDLLDAILREGHSRIPIFEESIDRIIGIIHARDLLQALRERNAQGLAIRGLPLREPHFIPENKRLLDLLREFRQSKSPIAIVVDEYGGTSGLVTIEDLLEEIVGEIMDESDIEEDPFQRIDDRTVLFAARVPIEDVNEIMESHLPEDEFDTIGGFVFGQVGRLPAPGQTILYDGLTLSVEASDGHRIRRVKVRKEPGPEKES
jgi:CBS domain containing-hemolysin-like protein